MEPNKDLCNRIENDSSSEQAIVPSRKLNVNSCPECRATRVCTHCTGTGKIWINSQRQTCGWCTGTGVCDSCRMHLQTIEKVIRKVSKGDLALAEVEIHQRFITLKTESQGAGQLLGIGGATVGAILGSLVLPGIGTVIGAWLGKAGGDNVNNDAIQSQLWQHADLLFVLAAIYQKQARMAEARECLIRAASLCPSHTRVNEALRGI